MAAGVSARGFGFGSPGIEVGRELGFGQTKRAGLVGPALWFGQLATGLDDPVDRAVWLQLYQTAVAPLPFDIMHLSRGETAFHHFALPGFERA